MRMLMTAQLPNEAFDGVSISEVFLRTADLIEAEGAYFANIDGRRTMMAIFDLKEAGDVPRIAGPLYTLGARVDFVPCMTAAEVRAKFPPRTDPPR